MVRGAIIAIVSAFLLSWPGAGGAPALADATAPAVGAVGRGAGGTQGIGADGRAQGVLTQRLRALARTAGVPGGASGRGDNQRVPGGVARNSQGELLVELRVSEVGEATLGRLTRAGLSITDVDAARLVVSGHVPDERLDDLAGLSPLVQTVREVRNPRLAAQCPTGGVSEGDQQLRAALARATYGVSGAGVTVGILSDSYDARGGAATDIGAAELPGPANPCGYSSSVGVVSDAAGMSDEGRAMAQIVHDLAPEARILMASAVGGQSAMAQRIREMAAAGANVIVDDVAYPDEPLYQDGVIAAAIIDVTAAGVMFFSAVGNDTVWVNGTSVGSYETTAFRPTACPPSVIGVVGPSAVCHDFDPSTTVADPTYGITIGTGTPANYAYILGWNEPESGVVTDLDLCLLDASDAVVDCSADDSILFGRPTEFVTGASTGSLRLVVARYGAVTTTPRFKLISTGSALTGVEYPTGTGGEVVGPTAYGHGVSASTISIAAVPYTNSAVAEPFSSRGPATTCWQPVRGTTAAAPLPACRTTTVDLAATDGGRTSFFGQLVSGTWRFYGTSAAAPHAAAVAALLRQRATCLSGPQILGAMRSTAVAVGSADANAVGSGLLDAYAAVRSVAGVCRAGFTPVAPVRVLDTRVGTGAPAARVGPGGVVTVSLSGVPANATAAVLNVTAVGATSETFVTVFPGGSARPLASNLNPTSGPPVPNLVTVALGAGGTVSLYNNDGSVDLVADLEGYYVPGSGSGAALISPARVLDTRIGTGAPLARVGADSSVTITVPGLPSTATAVMLNVTAVGSTSAEAYLTVYPGGTSRPWASNLNFTAGQTVPNLVIVGLGAGQSVTLYNSSGSVDLVADLFGYYDSAGGAAFVATPPTRTLDTRDGTGSPVLPVGGSNTLTSVARNAPSSAVGVVLNVTAVNATSDGFLSVLPGYSGFLGTSNLNFPPGKIIANLVGVRLGSGATVTYYSPVQAVNVVADIAGWFVN